MAYYYVNDNAQANGDHEVHVAGCSWLGLIVSKSYLGDYGWCGPAVAQARAFHYSQSNGCAYCCPSCHTS